MKPIIIVCEDDKLLQNFYSIILEKTGYEPLIFEDGVELLATLSEKRVALIIMDINLKNTYLNGKKTDGLALSRVIKEDSRFSHIPVLISTAFAPKDKNNNFLEESKANAIIYKPIIDFNDFLKTINDLIQYGK